ncbi:MAG: isochorismate synthase [Cytophagales bacterium]|nr:isochorismate synthase [Cytophagales bacterium]
MTGQLAEISTSNLVERLEGSEYSFASWRLPNQQNKQLIVCLEDVKQTNGSLNELSAGFLINSFDDHHPPRPYHIKADLIFSENESKNSSVVNAELIDKFLADLKKEPVISPDKAPAQQTIIGDTFFESTVESAVRKIQLGQFEKVVLSRFEDLKLPTDFSAADFFDQVCEAYPNAFCSLVHIPGKGLWIGASPELLISQDPLEFKTISLAGTKKLEADDQLSEIAWTQKEIEEQALVSRYIINCFKKIRLREFDEHGPKTIKAGNLAHLKTEYIVNLEEVKIPDLADQMIKLLHPTSAVCGMPLDDSIKFIHEVEDFQREFYAGFLGPVNFNDSTDLFVNLRCMKVEGKVARLFAGAGITENSHPSKELVETDLKLATMKNLI